MWRRLRSIRASSGVDAMSAITDLALQAAPATKARGYCATVARRITRDKVSMACAFILALIFLSALFAPYLGLADPYLASLIRRLRHLGPPASRGAWRPAYAPWPSSRQPGLLAPGPSPARACIGPAMCWARSSFTPLA